MVKYGTKVTPNNIKGFFLVECVYPDGSIFVVVIKSIVCPLLAVWYDGIVLWENKNIQQLI